MGDDEFAYYEYAIDDINQFSEIAQRPLPVGILSLDTAGRPETCARYREFLRPQFAFTHELRVVFRSHGHTWGVLGLYRSDVARPFTRAEASALVATSETVAIGIRRTLFAAAATLAASSTGPAVLVINADNHIQTASSAGRQRIDQLGGLDHGALPTTLLATLNAARTGDMASTRIRTTAGEWLVAQAATLEASPGGSSDVVITIEPASPNDLATLALAAFGLTNREQEVAKLVLQGTPTGAIATSLHLSPHTVQDHLKSVFHKSDVGSRRELTAKVFFGHHAPNLARPRQPDGALGSP